MNKFLYKFNKIFFSFFGIGFVPKLSKILTTLLALALVLLISDENRAELIGILIVTAITFYVCFIGNIAVFKLDFENVALDRAIGVWITLISPYILYSYEWLVIDFVIYILIFSVIEKPKLAILKKYNIEFLIREILTGIISLIILSVIYSGFNSFAIFKMFF
jgi:hypothetical protein